MKKIFYLLGIVVAMSTTNVSHAQDKKLFNHLAVGAEVGTTGWGFEAAMPVTHYVTLRTGFTTLPRFNVNFDVKYKSKGEKKEVDATARIHMTDYKLLFDVYPFKHSSLHVTSGFYVGIPDLGTVHNTGLLDVDEGEGLEIGGVFVRPDDYGTVKLKVQTRSFKPYVGIGFGRPVSKHRIGTAFDLGVMFWGKPAMKVYSTDEDGWIRVQKDDVDDKGFHDAVKIIERVTVYPVLNFRIYYNIF